MKFYAQSFVYDDPWSIVALAYFLRYPNPYASHVLSCDVISREHTPSGTLLSTRLILKRGALPRWFPKGIISRAETWVIEETEVDPMGQIVRCSTRNLDHVKVMQVVESVQFHGTPEGQTIQKTDAKIISNFGWGLAKNIESHALSRLKTNVQRSREGVSLILELLRQSRMQTMTLSGHPAPSPFFTEQNSFHDKTHETKPDTAAAPRSSWQRVTSWFYSSR